MAVAERRSTWLTIEGILLILLGVFALLAPLFAGLALALTLGILLVVAAPILILYFGDGDKTFIELVAGVDLYRIAFTILLSKPLGINHSLQQYTRPVLRVACAFVQRLLNCKASVETDALCEHV